MTKLKVRGLKWKMLKVRGLVLNFCFKTMITRHSTSNLIYFHIHLWSYFKIETIQINYKQYRDHIFFIYIYKYDRILSIIKL